MCEALCYLLGRTWMDKKDPVLKVIKQVNKLANYNLKILTYFVTGESLALCIMKVHLEIVHCSGLSK